jgi:hypothetical protein
VSNVNGAVVVPAEIVAATVGDAPEGRLKRLTSMSGASEPAIRATPKQFVVTAANSPGEVLAATGSPLTTIGTTALVKSATQTNADGVKHRVRTKVIRRLLVSAYTLGR